MEISDLIVFKAVVEQGGITRAAKTLHRVPSNVTARIQKLEQELETTLFVRDKNRLRISPAGETLLDYAQKILTLTQQAIDQLHPSTPTGQLKIGSMEATAANRLAGPLAQFHAQHPEVQLELQTNPSGTLIDQVVTGELDLAFVADPIKDPRLNLTRAYNETLILISHHQHPLIKTINDLAPHPTVLGFSNRCAYRTRLTQWLSMGSVTANVVEISSYHSLLACVAAGMGVGIIPESLLKDYPFQQRLKTHRLPTKIKRSTTYMVWRKDSVKVSMTTFAELIRNEPG